MAEKRGKGRTAEIVKVEEKGLVKDSIGENPSLVSSPSLSELQLDRLHLRERWELASVLNFLHVFKLVIQSDLEISAEEIETALITPNKVTAQLHTSLLKGIPPVRKNLADSDAWVTALCKQLDMWWPWMAEGELPIKPAHGEEISRYKELDPTTRLLILKALCEIRSHQDDAVNYVNDELKQGTKLSSFCKDRIAGDGNGISYWYDGDSVIGHRLYREVTKVELKPKLKGKGSITKPINSSQWETLATNLEEFRQISDEFSSSKVVVEAAVAKLIDNEIIPVLEGIEKKKERVLKRQQRQELLLKGSLNSYAMGTTRTCRERRPVTYTFDEYDKSIDEAIQLNKKTKRTQQQERWGKDAELEDGKDIPSNDNSVQNNGLEENEENDAYDDKFRGVCGGDDSVDDDDYDGKSDGDEDGDNDGKTDEDEDSDNDNGGDSDNSEKENKNFGFGSRPTRHSQKQKVHLAKDVAGLRRSNRLTSPTSHPVTETRNRVDTMKVLRQRPSHNTAYEPVSVSSSQDENLSENLSDEASGTEKESLAVLDGLLEESEEENSDA